LFVVPAPQVDFLSKVQVISDDSRLDDAEGKETHRNLHDEGWLTAYILSKSVTKVEFFLMFSEVLLIPRSGPKRLWFVFASVPENVFAALGKQYSIWGWRQPLPVS
jgi:hypothetical protein